jgi:hypothetical protein
MSLEPAISAQNLCWASPGGSIPAGFHLQPSASVWASHFELVQLHPVHAVLQLTPIRWCPLARGRGPLRPGPAHGQQTYRPSRQSAFAEPLDLGSQHSQTPTPAYPETAIVGRRDSLPLVATQFLPNDLLLQRRVVSR